MNASADAGTFAYGYQVKNDDERVTLVRNAVFQSVADPLVIWTAKAITSGCRSRDENCEIRSIYDAVSPYRQGEIPIPTKNGVIKATGLRFVKDAKNSGLRFVDDSRWIDNFFTAGLILQWLAEGVNGFDCDCHAIMVLSLCWVLGYKPGVVIVGMSNEFTHIYPVIGIPKTNPTRWLPMDTTVPNGYPGWMPPKSWGIKRMRIYELLPNTVKGADIPC